MIPSYIKTINDYVFYGCSSLSCISIPSTVKSIGNYAFCRCASLSSVSIPSSLKSIGNYAFYGCSSIQSNSIPSSVTLVEKRTISEFSSSTFDIDCIGAFPGLVIDGIINMVRGYDFLCIHNFISIVLSDEFMGYQTKPTTNSNNNQFINIYNHLYIIHLFLYA